MMERLKMPDSLAGPGVQANDAVREKIIAFAPGAVKIRGSRPGTDEYKSAFFIHARSAPVVCRPALSPALAFPGVVTQFTRTRNGMESPQFFPGPRIKGPRVAGGWASAFRTGKTNNYYIAPNCGGRCGSVIDAVQVGFHAGPKVQRAAVSERAIRLTGFR